MKYLIIICLFFIAGCGSLVNINDDNITSKNSDTQNKKQTNESQELNSEETKIVEIAYQPIMLDDGQIVEAVKVSEKVSTEKSNSSKTKKNVTIENIFKTVKSLPWQVWGVFGLFSLVSVIGIIVSIASTTKIIRNLGLGMLLGGVVVDMLILTFAVKPLWGAIATVSIIAIFMLVFVLKVLAKADFNKDEKA